MWFPINTPKATFLSTAFQLALGIVLTTLVLWLLLYVSICVLQFAYAKTQSAKSIPNWLKPTRMKVLIGSGPLVLFGVLLFLNIWCWVDGYQVYNRCFSTLGGFALSDILEAVLRFFDLGLTNHTLRLIQALTATAIVLWLASYIIFCLGLSLIRKFKGFR